MPERKPSFWQQALLFLAIFLGGLAYLAKVGRVLQTKAVAEIAAKKRPPAELDIVFGNISRLGPAAESCIQTSPGKKAHVIGYCEDRANNA